jgi:hypothetical protein
MKDGRDGVPSQLLHTVSAMHLKLAFFKMTQQVQINYP